MEIWVFPDVKTKSLIIGSVILVLAGWLVFGPEDETPESGNGREPETGTDYQSLPRQPEPLAPKHRYGIAGDRPPAETEDRYGSAPPYYYGQPGAPVPSYRPNERRPDLTERFVFRPLTEREREKLARERPERYYGAPAEPARQDTWSYEQPQGYPVQPDYPGYGTRQPYGAPPPHWGGSPAYRQPVPYSDWEAQGYRFRPYEPPPSGDGSWQRTYPDRSWSPGPQFADPWPAPADPQRSSVPREWSPPAERMYPNLDWSSDHRLTSAF